MTDSFPIVDTNPWLQAAFAFSLLILAPGLAWSWLVPLDELRETWRRKLVVTGLVLVIGLLCTTLSALALAETGRLTFTHLAGLLAVLCLGGILAGRKRLPLILRNARDTLPGSLLLLVAFAVVLLLPERGEWIVGGWDPGVYVNQGVNVSHTGTFHTTPLPWHDFMTADDWRLFTRGGEHYREIAPGIPVNTTTGTLEPYFFRLFPSLIAVLDLCGGLRAATRVSDFMAVAGLLVFAGMLAAWMRGILSVLAAITLLAIQPLWLYHAHIPTTEMFHLVLLCGVGLLLPFRRGRTSALLALLIFALILNRFDFVAFSALLIAVIALLDFPRDDRRTVMREHAGLLAGLAAGFLADILLCPITLLRLDFAVPKLVLALFTFVACAFATDMIAQNPRLRAALLRPQQLWRIAPLAALALGTAAVFLLQRANTTSALAPAATSLIPFLGIPILIPAAIGLALWALPRSTAREEKLFLLYLLATTLALFIEAGIVPTYPWSTRRFIPCLIPALAALGGTGIAALATAARGRLATATLAALLLLSVALANRHPAHRAIRSTDYDGASAALAQIATHIRPGDIVIADHHWWSTPLTFIHHRPTLDGNFLLHSTETNALPRALAAARRWQATGKRILFLTSTDKALTLYPHPIPATTEWTSPPITLREVIHTKTTRTYETKTRTFTFALHLLAPE